VRSFPTALGSALLFGRLVTIASLLPVARAQFVQQGDKLVGSATVGYSMQGSAVALSFDGNTAIVGGWNDNGGVGAAWIYTRSADVWIQQGPKLVGTGAIGPANQGCSVAISADGNTVIVGGSNDNRDNSVPDGSFRLYGAGAAWVFTRSGGVWSQQGPNLVGAGSIAPPGLGGPTQGASVALSGDGSTTIVGGPSDNTTMLHDAADIGVGAVWMFARTTSPTIAQTGVVNGATFQPGIAPGTWITIQGANLSATTRSWRAADFSGTNLPTQLDGVSVTVNSKSAYVAYISPTQLNVLTPDDTAEGPVAIQVRTPQGTTNIVNATEAAFSPALFMFSQQGARFVAAVRADGTYLGPPGLIPGLTTVPAQVGDTIQLFGTGFGPTTPATEGTEVVSPAPLTNTVKILIGGVVASTQFTGIVGPGLYQFNVTIPNGVGSDPPVVVEIAGISTQAGAYLAVQP
jgi:uncharacterized protein (TIGR03437 family)